MTTDTTLRLDRRITTDRDITVCIPAMDPHAAAAMATRIAMWPLPAGTSLEVLDYDTGATDSMWHSYLIRADYRATGNAGCSPVGVEHAILRWDDDGREYVRAIITEREDDSVMEWVADMEDHPSLLSAIEAGDHASTDRIVERMEAGHVTRII